MRSLGAVGFGVLLSASCGGEQFSAGGDGSAGSGGASTAGTAGASASGAAGVVSSGGAGATGGESGAGGDAGSGTSIDASTSGGSSAAGAGPGGTSSAGGSAQGGAAGGVIAVDGAAGSVVSVDSGTGCAGDHPIVGADSRYCEPGSCFCADTDECFTAATADACCNGLVVCTGVCPENLEGPDLVRIPILGTRGGYCVDETEVSRDQYAELVLDPPDPSMQRPECAWNTELTPNIVSMNGSLPVVGIDWCDAVAYCTWAGKRLCGAIGGGPVSPLLFASASQSQWFNACSAGGVNVYPYGSTYDVAACVTRDFDGIGGYDPGTDVLMPVGAAPTCEGGFDGLLDMSGNVWEWEDSCAGSNQDAGCRIRGGAVTGGLLDAECAANSAIARDARQPDVGFRCCASLVAP